MIGIVDTCYFLKRGPFNQSIKKLFVSSLVVKELKNEESKEYFNLHRYMIEIREPLDKYIEFVQDFLSKKMLNLSYTDIVVVALTIEINEIYSSTWIDSTNINNIEEVVCLTMDNGIKQCLRYLNLYDDLTFSSKIYKLRCFGCFSMYEEKLDFCKKCGLNTLTRVSVVQNENNNGKILLKKNYKFKPKVLIDKKGVELKSIDQREYIHFLKTKGYKCKKKNLTKMLGDI